MKKLTELTKEQEALIPIVKNEWYDLVYKNKGNINKALFEKQISWMYSQIGKEKPIIWYCDSPMMCQLIANILSANIKDNIRDNIRANIRDNIGDNIEDNIWANIGDNIRDNIRANIRDNIRDNIEDNIWANIRDNIGNNIWANIRDNIRDNIEDMKMKYHSFTYYGNLSDYGWVAFYDYFKRLDYFDYDWSNFVEFQNLLKSGVYDFIPYENIVIVSAMPTEIIKDSNYRLHNINGPAVTFKDGYSVYAIHGRILPSWLWERKDTITRDMFLTEKNAEIKGAMYSVLGERKIMQLLGAVEVDKQCIQHLNDEVEIVKLYKTTETFSEIDNSPLAWVGMTCPSTGSDYLIGCEPHFTNAKDAIASLSIFKPEEYSFDYRT